MIFFISQGKSKVWALKKVLKVIKLKVKKGFDFFSVVREKVKYGQKKRYQKFVNAIQKCIF